MIFGMNDNDTHHLCWDSTSLGVRLASQIDEVQVNPENRGARSLQMLGLLRIARDRRHSLDWQVLAPHKRHEVFGKSDTHHV